MPRPNYSTAKDNLQRPSRVSEAMRSSTQYQLRRLRGLINLYHWSLEWTIHADAEWTLGDSPYAYKLNRGDLWLLGIETIADFLTTGMCETAISASAEKYSDLSLRGHFNPRAFASNECMLENAESLAADDVEDSFTVKSHSGTNLTFEGRDLLTSALFFSPDPTTITPSDSWTAIPFDVISPALRQASNRIEKDLAGLGLAWTGPPYYRHCENGGQLLKYMKAKQIDGKCELADLDQHRCECCEIIDKALREVYERRDTNVTVNSMGLDDEKLQNLGAATQWANDEILPEADTNVERRFRLAYLSLLHAQEVSGTLMTDKEAYSWIQTHGLDVEKSIQFSELEDYRLPSLRTWITYVVNGRSKLGSKKNQSRAGRSGRSIVSFKEV